MTAVCFSWLSLYVAAPLQLDTRRTSSTPSALAGRMNVMLSYLRSYENMGSAWIFCLAGCKCASQTINAHHTLRQSTVFLARLLPTEHAECVIGVKVLRNTTSGKHKFKVRPWRNGRGSAKCVKLESGQNYTACCSAPRMLVCAAIASGWMPQ